MRRSLIVAAVVLLAACGSDNSDKLPDDLTTAEGVELPELVANDEVEAEPEPEAQNADLPTAEPADNADNEVQPRPPVALPKPSFDCGGSLSDVETLICSDPQLAELDRRLAREYGRATREATADQKQRLTALGRRYLADRNRCPTRDCVVQAYRWYLRDIETMMGWQNP